ncbi:MAG: hypothetical protein VX644_06205 [Planctomycetota bacterium]|nr:hypothetical protein [Planctomycetota bacterium]
MLIRSRQRILSFLAGCVAVCAVGLQVDGEELSLAISKSARQDLESIAQQLREDSPAFVVWSAETKAERHQELSAALKDLDALLKRSGEDREEGWKKYLRWDAVQEQLSAEKPDIRQLQPALAQFYKNHNGLEMGQFTGVRNTLRDYMNALVFQNAEGAKKSHTAQMAQLSKRLDAYLKQPNSEDAWAIGRGVGWLVRSRQAPEMRARLSKAFANDNLVLQASQRFVEINGSSEVEDTTDITDVILGTSITGVAETKGLITAAMVPNKDRVSIDIRLKGETTSKNVGTNRGVVIHNRGVTQIDATKRVYFDLTGIHSDPAEAKCTTDSTIDSIEAKSELMHRIAWKRVGKTKQKANSIASQHAEVRVEESVDTQAGEMLGKVSETYQEQFRKPLLRRDGFPEVLLGQSTKDDLTIQLKQIGRFQVAAATPAPALTAPRDLAVRIHESLVRNLSETALAGVTLTDEGLEELLREAGAEVPEELQISPDRESWSITFSSSRPISVEFRQNKVTIAIRGRRFTQGERNIADPIRIAATYRLEKVGKGSKLTRDGEVAIDFIGRETLNARQVAFRTVLRRKFGALFKPEFASEGLQLPGAMEKLGALEVSELSSANGWFVLSWKISEKVLKTARLVD